jgi:DNA-binding MarR family transcriptional regulator
VPARDPHDETRRSRHVGLALWDAAQSWRRRLTEEMAARGVPWYGEARASLIPYIGANGAKMADLPGRSGLSRQAVHQFVQGLEADGVLKRVADPDDARGRLVRFTEKGLAVLRNADACKRQIDEAYVERLGAEGFANLLRALAVIAADGPVCISALRDPH